MTNAEEAAFERLGCNDWPDDLWLPDVIEKHLGRAVELILEDTP